MLSGVGVESGATKNSTLITLAPSVESHIPVSASVPAKACYLQVGRAGSRHYTIMTSTITENSELWLSYRFRCFGVVACTRQFVAILAQAEVRLK